MADAAIHDHDHEDERGFFQRWFMSTNHKDIGILYLIVSALAGLISVLMTVYMRLELMHPGVSVHVSRRLHGRPMYPERTPLERDDHLPWCSHDVLCCHPCPVRRIRQLFHAVADRRAGYGVPADEQPCPSGCTSPVPRWAWPRC